MTEEEGLNWLAEVLECPAGSVTRETRRSDIPTWDSLGVLTLMAGLDEQFGITATSAEMGKMKQASDFIEFLKAQGKLG